jgi:hypothetical protein
MELLETRVAVELPGDVMSLAFSPEIANSLRLTLGTDSTAFDSQRVHLAIGLY